MNNRVRYTRQNIVTNSFYQLPKFLLDEELGSLTNDARVLYALLRNRHEISIKNGWYDDNGEVFLYFKREDMQNMLRLSDKTVAKAVKDLKEFYLLEEAKQGSMKPNRIYLLSASVDTLGIEAAPTLENTMTRKNSGSWVGDFTGHDTENLRVTINQNKEIQNNTNKISQSSQSEPNGRDNDAAVERMIESYTEIIKTNIGYDSLEQSRPHDIRLVDEIVAIILDTLMTVGKSVRIDGEDKPRALVKSQLMKLSYDDIELVIEQYKAVTAPISRKTQYILTMLYNAKMETDAHYTNAVRADMWQ